MMEGKKEAADSMARPRESGRESRQPRLIEGEGQNGIGIPDRKDRTPLCNDFHPLKR